MMEELQNIYSDFHWPIAATALNQCTIQMFHFLLKDESTNKALMLKLRLLDVLANISKVVSASTGPTENGLFGRQFLRILCS